MHEYSIVQALVERVGIEARAAGAQGVHRVEVSVGELAGVDVELLEAAYETFRERTICASADLHVHRIAARWECPACATPFLRGQPLQCRDCHVPARLAQGDEITIDRIELEVP